MLLIHLRFALFQARTLNTAFSHANYRGYIAQSFNHLPFQLTSLISGSNPKLPWVYYFKKKLNHYFKLYHKNTNISEVITVIDIERAIPSLTEFNSALLCMVLMNKALMY